MNFLATVLSLQGKCEEAEADLAEVLGEEHPDTLTSMIDLVAEQSGQI